MKVTLVISLVLFLACVAADRDIYVINGQLYVNGEQYVVKGVDYSPAPYGGKWMDPDTGYGGTGLCSAKLTPWNEWKSACYDSDYFDGSTDYYPQDFPQGFLPVWERDFPHIIAEGANTVRLYNANPSTRAATQVYTNLFPFATGKDHTQFMKYCEDNGLMVIFPLLSDDNMFATLDEATYKRYLRWQIDEVGNSSALLMWQLGNEMGYTWTSDWNDAATLTKINSYFDYARKYTLSRWNRHIPITSAVENTQSYFNTYFQQWHVDIVSVNVFGTNWGSLFAGSGSYSGITQLTCMYNKAFLITEFGITYVDGESSTYTQGENNQIWYNVVLNLKNGLLGGVYFEQTDEPNLGKDFGLFTTSINYLADGTNSNQSDVYAADSVAPRTLQYNDIVSGKYNNVAYNMNSNVFTLLGVGQGLLSSATKTDRCNSTTYKACPGDGNPKCSANGWCDRTSGTCVCAAGWSGTACTIATCPGTPQCSGVGVCSDIVAPPECICNTGYYGSSCQSTVASAVAAGTCPGGCTNGNGVCNTATWTCACWPGWTGADCAVTSLDSIGVTPTAAPTASPVPTKAPTAAPTKAPTAAPTKAPTTKPTTKAPTKAATKAPTHHARF